MGKHALIVGSAGQDGTLLTQHLRRQGYAVTGLNRGDVDVLDRKSVRERVADRPDEIYYLAAYHHSSEDLPPTSAEMFHRSMDVHFHGIVNFLDAVVSHAPSSRVFFASSSHVFAPIEEGMHTEDSSYQPQSEYAITKVAGMRACRHYRDRHGVFVCSGILYNHESSLRKPAFLSKKIAMSVARVATEGTGVLELADLDAQTDWGAAVDYVDAMFRMLQVERPDDYIVASGREHTVRDFVDVAFKYVGLDYTRYASSKRSIARRSNGRRVGDSSKLRQVTGWMPTMSFEQMVHGLVQAELDSLRENLQRDGGGQA